MHENYDIMRYLYRVISFTLLFFIYQSGYGQTYLPNNGATDVSYMPALSITFSPGDIVAINSGFSIYVAYTDFSNPIELSTGGTGFPPSTQDPRLSVTNHIFSIDLSSTPLYYGAEYLVYIPSGALTVNGRSFNDLNNPSAPNWTFTIENEPIASYTLNPANSATGVSEMPTLTMTFNSGDVLALNSGFSIYIAHTDFSNPIELTTGGTGFPPSSQDPRLQISNHVFTFDLSATKLDYSSDYMVYIPSGALTVNGSVFTEFNNVSNPNWVFTTIAAPIPTITNFTPLQDAVNVPVNQNFTLTFSENIQFKTPIDIRYISINPPTGPSIDYKVGPGDISSFLEIPPVPGNQLIINSKIDLELNTEYYITIPSGVIESTDGAGFAGLTDNPSEDYRFTTVGAPLWADGYPFTENISPINADIVGQTDHNGNYIYVVTSSSTSPSVIQIKNGTDHNGTPALYTNSGTPGTMSANITFRESIDITGLDTQPTSYYVYAVATSTSGFDSNIGATTFTTLERDAPITTFDPANGATDISVSSSIVITFDEPIRNVGGTIIDNSNAADLISIPSFTDYTVTIDATKTILTVTPNTPFNGATTYAVIVDPVEDYLGNAQSSASVSSFTTADYITWNGSNTRNPTNWDDPSNWTGALAPGANVRIPAGVANMPVISTNTPNFVKDMVVEAEATVDITSTGHLTVTGFYIMQSSNTGKGNASLLNQGTLNVIDNNNIQIHQSITSSPVKWYFLSSPVNGATQTNINCTGTVYSYNINTDTWSANGAGTEMGAAIGYKVYSTQNMSFSGAINNNSSYTFNANRTAANAGWNLAGNPYPCSIDWNLLDLGTNGITNGFWVWLNDTQQYGTYNGNAELGTNLSDVGTSLIPSSHSFWVKVPLNETSGTLTIPASARTHNTATYLKSGLSENKGTIRLLAKKGEQTDETVIAFNNAADDLFDNHDSEKRYASRYANFFEIFSITDGKNLSINSFYELGESKTVNLGVIVPEDGIYTISLKSLKNFSRNISLKLEDHSTQPSTIIDLSSEDYTVHFAQGYNTDRFTLHILASDIVTDAEDKDTVQTLIYSNNNQVYVNIPELTNPMYQLYTIGGQLIKKGELRSGVLNTINTSASGIVIVKITSKEKTLSGKVFVKQ